MVVLVDHSGEPVSAGYVRMGDSPEIGGRFGDSAQWCRLVHRLVGSVSVVMKLELAEGVARVAFVPDECAVQEFVAAGLDPAFHDGVHTRDSDAGGYRLDAGGCQDLVEERGELRVSVSIRYVTVTWVSSRSMTTFRAAWATQFAEGAPWRRGRGRWRIPAAQSMIVALGM